MSVVTPFRIAYQVASNKVVFRAMLVAVAFAILHHYWGYIDWDAVEFILDSTSG